MLNISIEKLDKLFEAYNYQVSKQSTREIRIYTLKYGMYHAAEIIRLNDEVDVTEIKNEFSQLGYATEIKTFSPENEIEKYLFEGFFIKTPFGNELKKRYKQFVNKQLRNLPDDSEYIYINSPYSILLQNEDGAIIESQDISADQSPTLMEKINELIINTSGSIFIIIEAPAGFGKTCTAFEILNSFSTEKSNKLPFFSELSRNREARIFKHILLNEIDEQFPTGIKKNIVLDQISKGRIPLIIDGFDELITKKSVIEEVESMLSTIIELLKGEAKVIVTTRKTAFFSSEEFFDSVDLSKNKFSIARIEIKEPTLENWLANERIQIIKENNFPLTFLENPVLLSYLRNISLEKFNKYLSKNSQESIVDKYLDYLLKREQVRQNLKLTPAEQLEIFRKLVRILTEYNITVESKDFIKDFIKDFNYEILKKSIRDYIPEERPTFEDLVEILSNHVLLDRKQNGNIGIINDFIFGLLVADNLILGKYLKYFPNYNKILPQDFASKAVQSFKVQSYANKKMLWEAFNNQEYPFDYDDHFFFNLDYFFAKNFNKNYTNLIIEDLTIDSVKFSNSSSFNQSIFSRVNFKDCFFDLEVFNNCTFYNCLFQDCSIIPTDCKKHFNDFAVIACNDNNDFLERISERIEGAKHEQVLLNDYEVLRNFFQPKKNKPVPRKVSYIKQVLSSYQSMQVNRSLTSLKHNHYIFIKDDICYISQKGVEYYTKLKESIL